MISLNIPQIITLAFVAIAAIGIFVVYLDNRSNGRRN